MPLWSFVLHVLIFVLTCRCWMPTGVLRSSVTRPCRSNLLPTTTPCRSTRASCPASRTRTTLFTRSVYFCVWGSVWMVEWINVLMLPWEDTRCTSVMLCSQNCFVPQLGNTKKECFRTGVFVCTSSFILKKKNLYAVLVYDFCPASSALQHDLASVKNRFTTYF